MVFGHLNCSTSVSDLKGTLLCSLTIQSPGYIESPDDTTGYLKHHVTWQTKKKKTSLCIAFFSQDLDRGFSLKYESWARQFSQIPSLVCFGTCTLSTRLKWCLDSSRPGSQFTLVWEFKQITISLKHNNNNRRKKKKTWTRHPAYLRTRQSRLAVLDADASSCASFARHYSESTWLA